MTRFYSTKKHRNAERTNATAEIAAGALKTISPIAALPAKLAQGCNSSYCAISRALKPHERVVHGIRALIAFAEVGILIAMLFKDEKCETLKPPICKSLLMCELLYQGLLLVSWVPSEFFKEEGPPTPEHTPPGTPPGTPPDSPTRR